MAFWEMFADRDFHDGKKWRNKGEKIEFTTRGNQRPTVFDISKATREKYGRDLRSYFKLRDKF